MVLKYTTVVMLIILFAGLLQVTRWESDRWTEQKAVNCLQVEANRTIMAILDNQWTRIKALEAKHE